MTEPQATMRFGARAMVPGGRSTALWQMSIIKDTVFTAHCEAGTGGILGDLQVCTVVRRPVRDKQERHGIQNGT